jgi:hypothetical protein
MQVLDQILHPDGWPLDPLKEDAAAKNQHPGDTAGEIATLSRLDDATDLDLVDAFGGTTAVDKSMKHGCVVIIIGATRDTELIEQGLARLIYARQAMPPGDCGSR